MTHDDKPFNLIDGATAAATDVFREVDRQCKIASNPSLPLDECLEAYEDVFDSEVGDTSLVRARNIEREVGLRQIYLKFEGGNPTGTQKDRIAFSQAMDALRRGFDTISVATCGNYGVATALERGPAQVAAMREGAVFVGHAETCDEDPVISAMHDKGISVIAMERIPRISRAQSMDALSSQSNIAGYRAVIEAAVHYTRFLPLMMTSAGSAKPARLVVLGAGVAGLQAIATARRLGADVHAYDVRPETREQIESLGAKFIDIDVGESGAGEGGYARELSDEAKQRQQELLSDELAKAHVIITTALIPCKPAPALIPEDVVRRMREGSVIIDLAAATGGNCPLTEADKVVEKHGVILVGHTNYPSMLASDASQFYANNLFNLIGIMFDAGEEGPVLKNLEDDEITQAALVTEA